MPDAIVISTPIPAIENEPGASRRVTTLHDLLVRLRAYLPPNTDLGIVERAYEYAAKAALLLADLQLDRATIAAALLHDVIEDTGVTFDALREAFGIEVARLVDGVTKLSRIHWNSLEEQQAENLRKMFLA
ncbi:MAG: bifunctional (p)ppGpp synthetase/guanosine-3',5'-bis(diphosphate) 3'-pyrophosphohydrolase, partial [Chloroflexi bacterium]|nr:bifunctional (p)ppGpp synthetase/guanosine-3',5'-bis(diphosphate) 3'-pyrophosphohydrolase [Chloroflexota bacterium]